MNREVLVLMVNRSPGFAMIIPETIENRCQLEKVRACWNLLMNTLGVRIAWKKMQKEYRWRKIKIGKTLSYINSGTKRNYGNF